MEEAALLEKLAEDVSFIKNKVIELEADIEDLHLYEPKEEYLEKLNRLEKNGKYSHYSSLAELRKEIEDV